MARFFSFLIGFAAIAQASLGTESPPVKLPALPGADLFTNGAVQQIRIEISPEDVQSLRDDSREYVPATVHDGAHGYSSVGVHLKGSTGSFRVIDDKPALTLSFNRFDSTQRFHGLQKIYLNNSVEDPSFVNEQLGSELFRAAGIPSPRVTRVVVNLNGRRLGLYVLKEGYTEDFLGGYFKNPKGNLYDTDLGHDVDQRMKKNLSHGPKRDESDLESLAATAIEPDLARRWQRLQAVLDVNRFVTFMALEIMVGHRDGYSLARNNFRIYHDLETDHLIFLPTGMDQLLERPDLPWKPQWAGLVAKAVMETPEGRRQYGEVFSNLFVNLFSVGTLTNRVNEIVQSIRPLITVQEFKIIEREASLVNDRIVQRRSNLQAQLNQPGLTPLQFTGGVAVLTAWEIGDVPAHGKLEIDKAPGAVESLHIVAGTATLGSWKTRILLNRGHYRFDGRAMTTNVKSLPYGKHQGAGLRVSGRVRNSADITGDSSWQPLSATFQVEADEEEVELCCELRANLGEAWFDRASLRLSQLQ